LEQFETTNVQLFFNGNEALISATITVLANGILPGFAATNPLLPTADGGAWHFTDVASGLWYDPPMTEGFEYRADPGTLFTSILDFPTGFDAPFTVIIDDKPFGTYGPGQSVDFSQFPGGGVSEFSITGISPLADAGDPRGFPLRLAFNADFANFTMSPLSNIPEPNSAAIWLIASIVTIAIRHCSYR
jgi:hypothetical protein